MVHDETFGKTVLFGGLDENGDPLGDTWEWDRSNWALRSNSPALARAQAAIAYDPVRGGVVMFGGRGAQLYNDTWFWRSDLGLWVPIAFGGPPARQSHAMAYDPIDGGILLVAGSDGSTNGIRSDQWFLPSASSTWVQVSPNPSPGWRHEHAMVTNTAEGRVYLFAGEGATKFYGDIWIWGGVADGWESMARQSPGLSNDAKATLAVDPVTGSAFMYGGLGDEGRIWRWNLQTRAWDLLNALGPGPRQWHVFVLDEASGKILLYGGLQDIWMADTWTFDPVTESWTLLETNAPPGPRERAAYVYDPMSQRVVV